jgi:CLIP-associating protein 1/2
VIIYEDPVITLSEPENDESSVTHHDPHAHSNMQDGGDAQKPVDICEYPDTTRNRAEDLANDIVDDEEHIRANVQVEGGTQKPEIQITTMHAAAADEPVARLGVPAENLTSDSKSEAASQASWPSNPGSLGLTASPFPSDLLQSTPDYLLKPSKTSRSISSNENWFPMTPTAAEKHAGPTASNRALSRNNALGELPSNEPDHRDNKAVVQSTLTPRLERISESTMAAYRTFKSQSKYNKRRNISPRSQDPERAKEMLRLASQRIRSGTLDMFGHRKLQTLLAFHDVRYVMNQATFDDLLQAVLEELRKRPDDRPLPYGDSVDFKMQVLTTLRFMQACTIRFFKSCYPQALHAILHAVRYFEPNCWFIAELRNAAVEFLMTCEYTDESYDEQLEHYLDAILDFVEQETRDLDGHKAINMAFSLLAEVLGSLNEAGARPSERLMERMGSLAAKDLMSANADVRRQVTGLCVQLRSMAASDDRFWEVVGQPRGTTRHVLAYYISREE